MIIYECKLDDVQASCPQRVIIFDNGPGKKGAVALCKNGYNACKDCSYQLRLNINK